VHEPWAKNQPGARCDYIVSGRINFHAAGRATRRGRDARADAVDPAL
jgi:hypothetical protein